MSRINIEMITEKVTKNTRFSIRATQAEKQRIARAAAACRKSISEFVLQNSLAAAKGLEMDNASFIMDPDDYDAFVKMLDEPPRTLPALRKLFMDPTSVDVPNI